MNRRPASSIGISLACLTLVLGGCASAGSNGSTSGSPDMITTAQLREVGTMSLYDAVRRIRPRWLRPRGVDSFSQGQPIKVYLDGQSYGTVDALRGLQTSSVEELEWLSGVSAGQRFGVDHGSGVILVTSMKTSG